MALLRLDKYLADLGIASRKELKQMVKDGRVLVNGTAVCTPETKINGERDRVQLDGRELNYARFHYYMLDKPAGILTAARDRSRRTVLDLFDPERKRMELFPVGRLDMDTTGLLILTTNGDYAHRVISPSHDVPKVYEAHTEGTPSEADIRAFAEGLDLRDGTHCRPAVLEILGEDFCKVIITEGKYHQVKRMLAAVGHPVLELRRKSIGALKLDDTLGPGNWREMSEQEAMLVFEAP